MAATGRISTSTSPGSIVTAIQAFLMMMTQPFSMWRGIGRGRTPKGRRQPAIHYCVLLLRMGSRRVPKTISFHRPHQFQGTATTTTRATTTQSPPLTTSPCFHPNKGSRRRPTASCVLCCGLELSFAGAKRETHTSRLWRTQSILYLVVVVAVLRVDLQ